MAGSGNHTVPDDGSKDFNESLSTYLLVTLGAASIAVIVWKVTDIINKYTRTVACLGNDRQRYFARPSPNLALIKRHVLYAPVLSKRHNREIQLSSAVNVGTLPTRFQLLFLSAYLATNVAFCVIDIPWAGDYETVTRGLRNRAGALATVNLIPLFVLAGRNNPLVQLLGISFDTYNLIHRWFGRIVVLEALVHTLAHFAKSQWTMAALTAAVTVPGLMWGFIVCSDLLHVFETRANLLLQATCSFVGLSLQAWSPIRHAFYEFFKLLHIALAALALVGLIMHLRLFEARQLKYVFVVVGIWILDRSARIVRIFLYSVGGARQPTTVEALPGNAVRVTMTLSRPWREGPGQHAYLYMPKVSFWQSHPFSVAWVDGADDVSRDKLAMHRHDLATRDRMRVSFIIRARTGFTDNLYQKAAAAPGGKFETPTFVEGPYGAKHPLDSYGSVVLFAGGVGITHQVPYVRDLVAGFADGTVATRKILLVWTIQSPEHLEWIRPWMTEILGMERRRDILRIMLFVSQPRSTKEIHSPSSTVQMFPGRPNIATILSMEQEQQIGAMAVSVCGPGTLSDEVRLAVRARQSRSSIDFIEEAFSW